MSFYQKLTVFAQRWVKPNTLFKYGFNFAPMFRRSNGRITHVSKDLLLVQLKLPINWKNRNYVGTIFGGSLFAAVDGIPMVQLMQLLGEDYVVWDKSATIQFKRPARQNMYADFTYTPEELSAIKARVAKEKEIDLVKTTILRDKAQTKDFCIVHKTLYVADKTHYQQKRKAKQAKA